MSTTSLPTWYFASDVRQRARAKIAATNGTFIAVLWLQGETDAAKSGAERLLKDNILF